MDIIGGIAAATEGLKLVNELRKIDQEVDKADLKLRLVELADKLLDAKQALQSAQETEFSLRSEIRQLIAKLEAKPRLVDDRGLLFEINDDGQRVGEPFCNHCYVKEDKLFRLVSDNFVGRFGYQCHNCEKIFFVTRNRGSLGTIHDLGEDMA